MKLMLGVLALALTGCGFREMEEIAISPEFTPEEQEQIIEAAESWFEAAPEKRVPVFIGEGKRGSVRLMRRSERHYRKKCESGIALADTALRTFKAPEVRICPNGREHISIVAGHELGHALSVRGDHLGHGNLMSKSPEHGPEALTDSDVEYVRGF